MSKPIIYQILPRLWGNKTENPVENGSLAENGTGKFSDIDDASLEYFKWLGCSHIWYTGVLRHSTQADSQGCTPSHPQFVKGNAGSPYAICDYYDVNAYLADDPDKRMEEFESLVERTHEKGLKVIIDFVPNQVSRQAILCLERMTTDQSTGRLKMISSIIQEKLSDCRPRAPKGISRTASLRQWLQATTATILARASTTGRRPSS